MAQIIFNIYYAVIAAIVAFDVCVPFSEKRSKYWYILFAAPLVIFASFRPIGMMRDDSYYVNILNWPAEAYFAKMASLRDPLFYAIAFAISHLSRNASLLLYFVGFVLILKLIVLYKIAERHRLIVLFMYVSIYWQLHDLTQLRVSLSAFFFLLFFYFIKKNNYTLSWLSIVGSMVAHAQGVLNFIFLSKTPVFSQRFLVIFSMFLLILLTWRVRVDFFDIYKVFNYFLGDPTPSDFNFEFREAFRSYYTIYKYNIETGNTFDRISPPLIFTISVAVHLNTIIHLNPVAYQLPVIKAATLSIVLAIFLSWLFSSVSDIQVRFYEYYFLAGLVLVSETKGRCALIGVYLLSLFYFVKFNVRWNIWDVSEINSVLNKFLFGG